MNYDYKAQIDVPVVPMQVGSGIIPMQVEAGVAVSLPAYNGPYEITPSGETQILETKNKTTTDKIVINPIPSNRGLIAWDGSILTVS